MMKTRLMTTRLLLLFLLVPSLMIGCGKGDRQQDQGTEAASSEGPSAQEAVTSAERISELLQLDIPKVLDFGRGKCVLCKKMAPILHELAEEYEGRAVIEIIDITEAGGRELAQQFEVRLIPTQVFLDRGNNEVWRNEGFLPRDEIVQKLTELGVGEK